jgi:hypothetical protein
VPPKPQGWQSAQQLRQDYVGGTVAINRRMATIQQMLVADLMAAGYGNAEARTIVEENLVGRKKPAGGQCALAASADALRLLELKHKNTTAPSKPEKWKSAWELSRDHIGYCGTITKKLEEMQAVLIGDVMATGLTEIESKAMVEKYLIGRKKPPQGREGMAASPDAVYLLEGLGVLTRRSTTALANPGI